MSQYERLKLPYALSALEPHFAARTRLSAPSLTFLSALCLFALTPRPAAALDLSDTLTGAVALQFVTLKVKTCANQTGYETSSNPVTASLSTKLASEVRELGSPSAFGGVLSATFFDVSFDYQSLTLRKTGTDAWCIEKVWLEYKGATIWSHPSGDGEDEAYVGVLPLTGKMWIDGDPGYVPSVRFSDITLLQKKGNQRAPLDIAIHTCSTSVNSHSQTTDPVSIIVRRDNPNAAGITAQQQALEAFVLNNPGDDRVANQLDRYRLDDHGVGFISNVKVQKTGTDGWCFDRVSLFVGTTEIRVALPRPVILDGATSSSLVEWNLPVSFGSGSFSDVAVAGYPALPFRRSATWSYPDRGATGQACRPDERMPLLAGFTYSDRCNDGLACLNNKCVSSGGMNQLCNELDPYFAWKSDGTLQSSTVPACDKPAGELDCIMTTSGVGYCLPNAGQEGRVCRNAGDSRGECNYGMECQDSSCIWVLGTEGYSCYPDVAVTDPDSCEGDLLCTGGVPGNECVDPLDVAWRMMWMSYAAYEIQPATCMQRNGFWFYDYHSSTVMGEDAEVIIGKSIHDNGIVVAFAGSESPTDWLFTDFNVKYTTPSARRDWPLDADWGNVRVHDGFMDYVMDAWSDTFAAVERLRDGSHPTIYLTGHSLGGAAAQIFGAMLNEFYEGEVNIQVVTFGSPRVGDAAWRTFYNGILGSHTHRWVNDDDVITGYPFNNDDWKQTGRRHQLGYDSGVPTYALDTGERSVGVWNGETNDHKLSNYTWILQGLLLARDSQVPLTYCD